MRRIAILASVVLCAISWAARAAGEISEALAGEGSAVEVPAAFRPPAAPEAQAFPRLLFEAMALEPAARLSSARLSATAEIAAITNWNAASRRPQKNGFVRPLDRSLRVEIGAEAASTSFAGIESHGLLQASPDSGYTWVTRIEVEEASRLRLRLGSIDLPDGTRMLVYNEEGEAIGFGLELRDPNGELWSPSVAGPKIYLEVSSSRPAAAAFEINAVEESFELDETGQPLVPLAPRAVTSCIVSSPCVSSGTLPEIAAYRQSVARIGFIEGGSSYVCTASLLNDKDESGFIPYALTANHCISTQGTASTLEAFWDYFPANCGGSVPSLGSRPRSNGSTLLASSASSDFAFLRLGDAPLGANGRWFLGWTTTTPNDGASLYGVHHPFGWDQAYSRTVLDRTPSLSCDSLPPTHFYYANRADGATFGGSSGSPTANRNLQVVGQLYGRCGINITEPCFLDSNGYFVFGAFSRTYPAISSWLERTGGVPGPPCADDATTLCLLNSRFKIQATYRTSSGQTGAAKAVRLTQETGYFWFFNQSNIETVFKLLDGCGINSRFWVFAGGLTDVEVTTTITDTRTGTSRSFFNPLNTPFQPIGDSSAFATCQ